MNLDLGQARRLLKKKHQTTAGELRLFEGNNSIDTLPMICFSYDPRLPERDADGCGQSASTNAGRPRPAAAPGRTVPQALSIDHAAGAGRHARPIGAAGADSPLARLGVGSIGRAP